LWSFDVWMRRSHSLDRAAERMLSSLIPVHKGMLGNHELP
jgi:hypothetical protein